MRILIVSACVLALAGCRNFNEWALEHTPVSIPPPDANAIYTPGGIRVVLQDECTYGAEIDSDSYWYTAIALVMPDGKIRNRPTFDLKMPPGKVSEALLKTPGADYIAGGVNVVQFLGHVASGSCTWAVQPATARKSARAAVNKDATATTIDIALRLEAAETRDDYFRVLLDADRELKRLQTALEAADALKD